MKKSTRATALLLAAALCLSLCGMSAGAEETPPITAPVPTAPGSPDHGAPVVIEKLLPPDVAFLPILPLGSDVASALPQTVCGLYDRTTLVDCPVTWDTSALTGPGRYTVPGTVSAPDGFVLKEGLEHTAVTVAVYVDDPVVFFAPPDRGDAPYHGTVLLGLGGDAASVLPYDTLDLVSPQGDWLRTPVEWDLSALDAGTAGRYTVYAVPLLPPGAGLLEPESTVAQDVYVMAEDAVDLGAYDVGVNVVTCAWLTAIDPRQAVLELSTDAEHWRPVQEVIPDYDYQVLAQSLVLDTAALAAGTEYYFRLVYQNRSDGVLHITVSEHRVPTPDWEGDRDGGDAGGTTPDEGDTVQPPPAPDGGGGDRENDRDEPKVTPAPISPAPVTPTPTPTVTPQAMVKPTPEPPAESTAPAAPSAPPSTAPSAPATDTSDVPAMAKPSAPADEFLEVFGEDRDLISGTRLLLMLETGGEARFSKKGVTVCLSAAALNALGIQDSDRVEVAIGQETADTVFISVSINGVPLSALPDTRLMVPYRASGGDAALLLTDEQGTEVSRGEYDAALAVASFRVDAPGRFTITEQAAAPQPTATPAPNAPQTAADGAAAPRLLLPLGGAVLAAGGWLLLKRGRKK